MRWEIKIQPNPSPLVACLIWLALISCMFACEVSQANVSAASLLDLGGRTCHLTSTLVVDNGWALSNGQILCGIFFIRQNAFANNTFTNVRFVDCPNRAIFGLEGITLINCEFINCGTDCSTGCNDRCGGGAVSSPFVNAVNTTFTDCYAVGPCSGGGGGAIMADTVTLDNVTFHNCSSNVDAGAVFALTISARRTIFRKCQTLISGGGLRATQADLNETAFDTCSAGSKGGGLYAGRLTAVNCHFLSNLAGSGGGAQVNGATFLTDTEFDSCHATAMGGCLYLDTSVPPPFLNATRGAFRNCSGNNGGCARVNGMVDLENTTFLGCTATGNGTGMFSGFGGGLFASSLISRGARFFKCNGYSGGGARVDVFAELINTEFEDCNATREAGCLYATALAARGCDFRKGHSREGGCVRVSDNVTLTETAFDKCNATGSGGGLYCTDHVVARSLQISNCRAQEGGGVRVAKTSNWTDTIVENCQSEGNGGAIYANGALVAHGLTISNCQANSGGALRVDAPITLTDTAIFNCSAGFGGGGIYTSDALTAIRLHVSHCSSWDNGGGARVDQGLASLTHSHFHYCSSTTESAGAIYASHSLSATNSTFAHCTAAKNGGALRVDGPTWLTDTAIFNSSAGGDGGCLSGAFSSNLSLTAVRSFFSHCQAEGVGGAVARAGPTILRNCSFEYCSAGDAGAVNVASLSADCILFKNCAAARYGAVQLLAGGQLQEIAFVNCSAPVVPLIYCPNTESVDLINWYHVNTAPASAPLFEGGVSNQTALSQLPDCQPPNFPPIPNLTPVTPAPPTASPTQPQTSGTNTLTSTSTSAPTSPPSPLPTLPSTSPTSPPSPNLPSSQTQATAQNFNSTDSDPNPTPSPPARL